MIYKTVHRKLNIEQHEPNYKTWEKLTCFGRESSSRSTCVTRCVSLVTNPDVSHDGGKDRIVITIQRTCPWSFVTHTFRNGQQRDDFNLTTGNRVVP